MEEGPLFRLSESPSLVFTPVLVSPSPEALPPDEGFEEAPVPTVGTELLHRGLEDSALRAESRGQAQSPV